MVYLDWGEREIWGVGGLGLSLYRVGMGNYDTVYFGSFQFLIDKTHY